MSSVTQEEVDLFSSHSHPHGALAVLDVLRARPGEWILRDWLQVVTGQDNIRSRVSELRIKGHFDIECNRRAGRRTAYRLVRP